MACRSVGLVVFLSMQNDLEVPEQNMEQPLAMTAENVASYTRQTIIDAVRRFNTDILDTLDEWEIQGMVNALNNLRQTFGLDPIRHNLNCEIKDNALAPTLDEQYWDCECERHYIHLKKNRTECPVCGASEENQPDSRITEIALCTQFFNNIG